MNAAPILFFLFNFSLLLIMCSTKFNVYTTFGQYMVRNHRHYNIDFTTITNTDINIITFTITTDAVIIEATPRFDVVSSFHDSEMHSCKQKGKISTQTEVSCNVFTNVSFCTSP